MKYACMDKETIRTLPLEELRTDQDKLEVEKDNERGYRKHMVLMNELMIIETELKRRGNPLLPEDVFL